MCMLYGCIFFYWKMDIDNANTEPRSLACAVHIHNACCLCVPIGILQMQNGDRQWREKHIQNDCSLCLLLLLFIYSSLCDRLFDDACWCFVADTIYFYFNCCCFVYCCVASTLSTKTVYIHIEWVSYAFRGESDWATKKTWLKMISKGERITQWHRSNNKKLTQTKDTSFSSSSSS